MSNSYQILLQHLNLSSLPNADADRLADAIQPSVPVHCSPLRGANGAFSNWSFELLLGTRTFCERDLQDSATFVDLTDIPGAPLDDPIMTEDEQKTKRIALPRFAIFKDACSTTVPAGFRIAGISGNG